MNVTKCNAKRTGPKRSVATANRQICPLWKEDLGKSQDKQVGIS